MNTINDRNPKTTGSHPIHMHHTSTSMLNARTKRFASTQKSAQAREIQHKLIREEREGVIYYK
jgi:hypothetical protein